MTLGTLKEFLQWCVIINAGILIYWFLWMVFGKNFMYRMHTKWFNIPRDQFDVILYKILGYYKIAFIVFILVPYFAVLIIT